MSEDETWQLETIYVTVQEDKPSSGNGGSSDGGHGGGADTKGQNSGGSGNYDQVSHEPGWNTVRSNREPSPPPQSSAESPYGKTTAQPSNSQTGRGAGGPAAGAKSTAIGSPLKVPSAWDHFLTYFESVRGRSSPGAEDFRAGMGGTQGVSGSPGTAGPRYPVISNPFPDGARPSKPNAGRFRAPFQPEVPRVPTTPRPIPPPEMPELSALRWLAANPALLIAGIVLWPSETAGDISMIPYGSSFLEHQREHALGRLLPGGSQDVRPLFEPQGDWEMPARRDPSDPARSWVEPSHDEAVRDDPDSDLEGPLEAAPARMSNLLRELMQSGQYLDPLENKWTDWPGPMEADHFIPVRYIKTMPGFQKLDPKRQATILRYEGNVQPLPRHHNRYKSDHMPSEWWFTLGPDGEFHVVNAEYLAEAAKWEQKVIKKLQREINSQLHMQSEEHRNKSWGSGWPW